MLARITDSVGTRACNNPSVNSDTDFAEGEEGFTAEAPAPSPVGETVAEAVEDQFVDPSDGEDDGTAMPSEAHGDDHLIDGKEAPRAACLPVEPVGTLNLGGDPPIEKKKIANIAHLACNRAN